MKLLTSASFESLRDGPLIIRLGLGGIIPPSPVIVVFCFITGAILQFNVLGRLHLKHCTLREKFFQSHYMFYIIE